jgi:DNA-binding beta-propeller fold protein YncE
MKFESKLPALIFALAIMLSPVANSDVLDFFKSDKLTDGSRFAFVPSAVEQTIIAIDTLEHKVAAELEISHVAHSVVASDELDLLFATDPDNESLTVINLYTREEIKVLTIGMRPDAALLSPSDRFVAFSSNDGSVSVWDMFTFEQVLRVDGLGPALSITFGFDGGKLYVVEPGRKVINVVDLRQRKKVAEINLGGEPDTDAAVSAMSRSADGYTGYVSVTSENRVVVLDLVDDGVKDSVPVGKSPIRPYNTADNRYVLVPNSGDGTLTVLSALSKQVIATIPTNVKAREVNTGWLDTVAFIMPATGNRIGVVDLGKLKPLDPIQLPGRSDDGLVTSDSKTLFTALIDGGQVAAIDARTHELETLIETGATTLEGIEIAVSNNVCH